MSSDKGSSKKYEIVAAAANSLAAEKLASALSGCVDLGHKLVDYAVGPKRIEEVNVAKARSIVHMAEAEAAADQIWRETSEHVRNREFRKTINRRAIANEAFKALPPPGVPVSDEPISQDFIPNVMDDFDGVSDAEVQKIVGRLIAGEVTTPGSYPRSTIRVLRDLGSPEFKIFTSLCRTCWNIGGLTPLVFEPNDPIYQSIGLNFSVLNELASLRLITFEGVATITRLNLPSEFVIGYGLSHVRIKLQDGASAFSVGHVAFSGAGQRLAPLTDAPVLSGFTEYVVEKWRSAGHQAEVINTNTS